MATRKPYPSDVSHEEWVFVAPYLALVREDAPQPNHDLREVFNGLRWIVRTGSAWRYMPHDLPPWEAVYQQTQRWLKAGVFEGWSTICACSCGFRKPGVGPDGGHSRFAHPQIRHRRAGIGAATTGTRARRDRNYTPPWTPWGTCSPCA